MNSVDLIAIAAVLFLGVPHGGLDGVIARRIGWPEGLAFWFGFHILYVSLAALFTGLWWFFPLPSLCIFLCMSGLHFGASDIASAGIKPLPLVAHGGFVPIAIPGLHPDLVEPLFDVVVGADNAKILIDTLTALFVPWLVLVFGYCLYVCWKSGYRVALATLLVQIGFAALLPPLVSFSLYFCLLHSRGHLQRLWQSLAFKDRSRSVVEAATYTVMVWVAAAVYVYFFQEDAPMALVKLTFIGLAALTLPHMLLVDFAYSKMMQRKTLAPPISK